MQDKFCVISEQEGRVKVVLRRLHEAVKGGRLDESSGIFEDAFAELGVLQSLSENGSARQTDDSPPGLVSEVLQRAIDVLRTKHQEVKDALAPPPPPPPPPQNPATFPAESPPATPASLPATPGTPSSGSLEKQILSAVVPPCLRRGFSFASCIGAGSAKQSLQEAITLPAQFPALFSGKGRAPWNSVLLYGPPGTGKTLLAKAVAAECGPRCTFFSITASDLLSRWMGESERLMRLLFETARARAPSVIFIDEVDAFCKKRDASDSETAGRMKTEFLVQMGGLSAGGAAAPPQREDGQAGSEDCSAGQRLPSCSSAADASDVSDGGHGGCDAAVAGRVFLLAATNLPWELDTAVLRRFEMRTHVPLPGLEERAALLRKLLSEAESGVDEEGVAAAAARTEGFSGSDLQQLVKQANMLPVRELLAARDSEDPPSAEELARPPLLQMRHLESLLDSGRVHPTVSPEEAQRYLEYERSPY